MLKQFISKEEKQDFIQSVFVIGATLVCSIIFITIRIFPRLEVVLNRFLNKGACKLQEDKNGRPIKKRYTILGKTLRR
jgi:hypothetical protein